MKYPTLCRAGGCYSAFREPAQTRRSNIVLLVFATAVIIGNWLWR